MDSLITFKKANQHQDAPRTEKPGQPLPIAPAPVPAAPPIFAGVLANQRKDGTDGRTIIVRGSGWILDFHVCNTSAGTLYLQLFDNDALPGNGSRPARVWTLPTLNSFDGIHLTGWPFGSGFCLVLSSTQASLTVAPVNSAILDSTLKMK